MGAAKLSRVRQKMAEAKVGGFLVTSHLNWRYLSGFKGDAGMLLITDRSAYLYTDSRYTEEATEEAPDFTVIQTGLDDDPVKDTLNREGIKQVAFEKEHVTFSLFEKFQTRFEGVELKGVAGWIEDLRMVKTPERSPSSPELRKSPTRRSHSSRVLLRLGLPNWRWHSTWSSP